MLTLGEIEQFHIELTTKCNARCPMCMRNYRGMDYNSGYPDAELTLENIQHVLPPIILKQVKQVRLNGNLGDFGLAQDAQEIVKYFVEQDTKVWISTNGSMRTPNWWAQLAHPLVTIGFALDGLADTHSLYRQDTDWNRIIKNAQAFIDNNGRAIWRWIPFEHNRHQEQQCRELAQKMGFVEFRNIGDRRSQTPVYTRGGKFSHWIGDPTNISTPPIESMIESHVTWFDSKTIKHTKDTVDLDIDCKHKKHRELYLAADGTVYPCCYLGFYPTTMAHSGNTQLVGMVKENNALEYSLEHCIEWFNQVEESWGKQSVADGRIYTCVDTCSS